MREAIWHASSSTYIDDLEAFLEQLIGLIREKVFDSVDSRLVRLVNVNLLPWARSVWSVFGREASCVVEYDNSSGSSAVSGEKLVYYFLSQQ